MDFSRAAFTSLFMLINMQMGGGRCAPSPAKHSYAAPINPRKIPVREKIRKSATASLSSTMQMHMAL